MSALESLEGMYLAAQENLNDMLAACPTNADRALVQSRYAQVQENYFDHLHAIFRENDAELAVLVEEAGEVTGELKAIDLQLGDIAKVLNVLGRAVQCGSSILSMAV